MATPEERLKDITPQQALDHNIRTRPSVWSQVYTRLRGRPYRFEECFSNKTLDLRKPHEIPRGDKNIGLRGQRQFLQIMLDDQHPHKAEQKSRQCGATENEVRERLWFADVHPFTKQVYVFPTFDQVADFSKTRMEEVMKDSPYVRDRMGFDALTGKKKPDENPVDNVRLRRMGNSFIFFRSGHTAKAGEGIDCDCVTFDEIDRMNPYVTVAFNETLSSSAFGWRRDVSTPSLPGVGVNASFQKSDQRHWVMQCPHCNHYFDLLHDFPKCVIELPKGHRLHEKYFWMDEDDTHAYQCMKCKELVSDETRIKGCFLPFYPQNKIIHGYQISQLMCAWISATQLMRKKEEYRIEQLFVNYVIGLPYLGENIMLSDADIMRCVDRSITNPYELKRTNVCIGGDWGNDSWGIAGMPMPDSPGKFIILDIWHISDRDAELQKDGRRSNPHVEVTADKMRQWNVKKAVFDAGYGKDKNWDLMQTFPGRVFSCFYPNLSTASTKNVEDQWSENDFKVSVDRTLTLQTMSKAFREGKFIIPAWVAANPLFGTFKKHLTNLVVIKDIEEEESTHKEIITTRIGTLPGGDHFGHSANYLMICLRNMATSGRSDCF